MEKLKKWEISRERTKQRLDKMKKEEKNKYSKGKRNCMQDTFENFSTPIFSLKHCATTIQEYLHGQ